MLTYQIEFFTFWHTGSGLSGSTYADQLVKKTENGFPVIPGKTIKGLLREGAETIHSLNSELVTENFIKDVFGEEPNKEQIDKEDGSLESKCFFSNIELSQYLQEKVSEKSSKEFLYQVISSTKIDATGSATEGSLRQLEVTIPLTLYGVIESFPMEYIDQLKHCMDFVKRIGLNRNRGLGNCQISILENN